MTTRLLGFLLPLTLAVACALTSVAWAGGCFEKDDATTRGHDPAACFKDGQPAKSSDGSRR